MRPSVLTEANTRAAKSHSKNDMKCGGGAHDNTQTHTPAAAAAVVCGKSWKQRRNERVRGYDTDVAMRRAGCRCRAGACAREESYHREAAGADAVDWRV